MVSLATANELLAALDEGDVTVQVDPASGLPLVGSMVGSSSRGPTMQTNVVKPEIGAPGASVSAEAGTGTETTPFGGTSGAAPMVTGSAALLLSEFPDRSPAEIKSLLMNYAETEIYNGAPDAPINSPLAAIARIGAGEVRVNDSYFGCRPGRLGYRPSDRRPVVRLRRCHRGRRAHSRGHRPQLRRRARRP